MQFHAFWSTRWFIKVTLDGITNHSLQVLYVFTLRENVFADSTGGVTTFGVFLNDEFQLVHGNVFFRKNSDLVEKVGFYATPNNTCKLIHSAFFLALSV